MVGVQYSRGCPFDWEFCNVIDLNGRVPRAKTTEQVLRELDALRAVGYRGHVDFVDDNLIGNRKALKPFLRDLRRWLDDRGRPFEFSTEASLDLAEDDELLRLMREANFFAIIVGLDAEPETAAREMIACIEVASIPVCMVGLLYALPGTRLARRLHAEGRLEEKPFEVLAGDADQCTSGLNFTGRRPRACSTARPTPSGRPCATCSATCAASAGWRGGWAFATPRCGSSGGRRSSTPPCTTRRR